LKADVTAAPPTLRPYIVTMAAAAYNLQLLARQVAPA